MQDPELFLEKQGIPLADYFDPARAVRVADVHRIRINYENYLFADEEGAQRFQEDPGSYCGLVTDPVTKHRFHPGQSRNWVEHEGVRFYFESPASRTRFASDPDHYALPRRRM